MIEKFEDHASEAAYAVVLATGDDLGRAKAGTELEPRARRNVVFELGFFFGAIGRARAALLHEVGIEQPSDVAGLVTIALDDQGAWKMHLARELQNASVPIEWSALGKQ